MPPIVIDVRTAEDARDVVHRAVQALAEGKLVAFPTETVYGLAASAQSPEAVQRLIDVKGRGSDQPLTLAIKSEDDALDYVPDMNPLARRLARRCWPGPVTLVVEDNHPDSLIQQLPESVRSAVVRAANVGLRVPAHRTILDVLQMLAGPIALSSANRTGQADAVSADDVVASLGDDVQLVLDDGPSRYGQPSSVVKVDGKRLDVLRQGVVTRPTLDRLASFMVLLVCTGNTCRSPMAEALCRKLIAERLGCAVDEVEDRGVIVMSAGIAATSGARPSPEAVAVVRDQGLSLEDHESQPLAEQHVRHADLILTMTRAHRDVVVQRWPGAAARVHVLRADQADVSDPIGGAFDVYQSCAEQILAELKPRVAELDIL